MKEEREERWKKIVCVCARIYVEIRTHINTHSRKDKGKTIRHARLKTNLYVTQHSRRNKRCEKAKRRGGDATPGEADSNSAARRSLCRAKVVPRAEKGGG